jgi:hypothetical protein
LQRPQRDRDPPDIPEGLFTTPRRERPNVDIGSIHQPP